MASQVETIIGVAEDQLAGVTARLMARVQQALTSVTPVDTGYARASWSPSTGSPQPGPSDRPSDRSQAQSQANALESKHGEAMERIRTSYKLTQGPIYIVNPVHYVRYLNEGSSAQAPAYFVEWAIGQAIRVTQREVLRG